MSAKVSKHQLFPHDIVRKLRNNAEATNCSDRLGLADPDHVPVVKIFNPFGASTWILTELYADNDTLYGLCDLGNGFPELGCVSRAELEAARVQPALTSDSITGDAVVGKAKSGVPLERDEDWMTDYPLTVWLEAAQREGRIVDEERALAQAAVKLEREPRWQRRQEEQHA